MREAVEAVAEGTWPSLLICCQSHLLTCPYQDVHFSGPSTHLGWAFWGSQHGSETFLFLQRLLVQTSVQAKPGHMSPLQLTNIPVPQQVSLPHLAPALIASPGCRTNS